MRHKLIVPAIIGTSSIQGAGVVWCDAGWPAVTEYIMLVWCLFSLMLPLAPSNHPLASPKVLRSKLPPILLSNVLLSSLISTRHPCPSPSTPHFQPFHLQLHHSSRVAQHIRTTENIVPPATVSKCPLGSTCIIECTQWAIECTAKDFWKKTESGTIDHYVCCIVLKDAGAFSFTLLMSMFRGWEA